MSSELTYKCDGCPKIMGFEQSAGLVRIEIEQRGEFPYSSRTLLVRDYCPECWEKRASAVNDLA